MAIRLEGTPSTDGLGVRRWTYQLPANCELHVFERPSGYVRPGFEFMLRVEHRLSGLRLGTYFRATRAEAARLARAIQEGED